MIPMHDTALLPSQRAGRCPAEAAMHAVLTTLLACTAPAALFRSYHERAGIAANRGRIATLNKHSCKAPDNAHTIRDTASGLRREVLRRGVQ